MSSKLLVLREKGGRRVKKSVRVVAMATVPQLKLAPKPSMSRRRRRGRRDPTGLRGSASAYTQALENPFTVFPRPLGLGTMVPTDMVCGWLRNFYTSNGTITWVVYAFRPQQVVNNVSIWFGNSSLNATPLSGVSSTNVVQFQNSSAIQIQAQTGRLVSAGLRVRALSPGTGLPGQIFAGFNGGDSWTNFQSQSVNDLLSLSCTTRVDQDIPFAPSAQVNYRPSGLDSFDFYPQLTGSEGQDPSNIQPICYILCVGFPTGLANFECDAISHMEVQTGFDATAGQADPTTSGGGSTLTIEDVTGAVRRMSHIVGKIVDTSASVINTMQRANALFSSTKTLMSAGQQIQATSSSRRSSGIFIDPYSPAEEQKSSAAAAPPAHSPLSPVLRSAR